MLSYCMNIMQFDHRLVQLDLVVSATPQPQNSWAHAHFPYQMMLVLRIGLVILCKYIENRVHTITRSNQLFPF
jgi:hypothetical protein